MTSVLCTPHFLMINRSGACETLLTLLLNVKIEHTFVFRNIMLHTGEKGPKTT